MLIVVMRDGMRYVAEMIAWGKSEWGKSDALPGLWFYSSGAMKFVKREDILTIEWPGKLQ